jgi:ABC-type nickel/cobalt efflux system permease component RcnA
MTTQRLARDWRLPTAGVMLLAILFAGFTLHAHWNAFIQWCLATQITLHRYLVMYLLQLNNHQYSGGLWLLTGLSFMASSTPLAPGTENSS